MTIPHRTVALLTLMLPIVAVGGPLVVPDGQAFHVEPGEKLVTGDVMVNGFFRNFGVVTHNGVFENFGQTENEALFNNLGKFHNSGDLFNSGIFNNDGSLINDGLLISTNVLQTSVGAMLVNNGQMINYGELSFDGQLINNGELINDGTWHINDVGMPGSGDIVNNGTITNFTSLTIDRSEFVFEGQWHNESTMNLNTDVVRIEGLLRNDGPLMRVMGDVEVAEGGTLEHRGTWTDIDGVLTNHGTTLATFVTLQAARVENHGDIQIDSQLVAEQFVQHDGSTIMGTAQGTGFGELVASSVQIYGGLFAAGEYGNIANFPPAGPNALVEIFGGTISGGANRLHIFGDLVLYDGATMELTLRNDDGQTRVGDIATTGEMTLAGSLVINLEPDALIAPGDVWTLAGALSISGFFDSITLPTVAGISFEVLTVNLPGFDFLQLHAVQAVPLPIPLVLFISASGMLLGFRRRQS